MKVYAILISSGDGEDTTEWIDSIWDDAVKAEEVRKSIVKEYLEMRETEIPDDNDIDLWAEALETREAGMDFNCCEVIEFELNERKQ